jgi:hypothetical protein
MEQAVITAEADLAIVIANFDPVPVRKLNPLDPLAIDVSPVGAPQIDEPETPPLAPDHRVIPRDLLTLEQDIISGPPADSNLCPRQAEGDPLLEPAHK